MDSRYVLYNTGLMSENLYQIAKKYIEVIRKIEKTADPKKLTKLEELRVDLHWKLMDKLKEQGIKYKDRDHATRIALRIANGEL
ncbi:MAG: hypothetical protein H6757_00855 [Candidatus Omnitrophica bacterium]|nr:hypothetical protein [Candidatus Omnitrophota bacterium]